MKSQEIKVIMIHTCIIFFVSTSRVGASEGGEVMLTSSLSNSGVAYDGQEIVFSCRVIDSVVLTWLSDEYIGTGGTVLQVSIAHQIGYSPPTDIEGTVVTLTNRTQVNGINIIDSELRIRATLLRPTSLVTCRKDGAGGTANTITFRVLPPEVLLTSNLANSGVAYDGQEIVFNCRVIDSVVLTWLSDEYIGTGGTVLQVSIAHQIGYSPPTDIEGTVVTLTNKTQVNGINIIDSKLHIRATLLRPTSLVTCRKDGVGGAANMTTFQVVESPVHVTTVVQDKTGTMTTTNIHTDPTSRAVEGAPDTQKGWKSLYTYVLIGVGGVAIVVAVATAAIAIIIWRKKGRSKVSRVDPDEEQEVDKGLTVEQPYGKSDQDKVEQPCEEADQDEIDQGNEKGVSMSRQASGESAGSAGSDGSDDSKNSRDLLLPENREP